ncbi:MAG: AAA family ATPase [Deltaproteobacteria bacterium]|nr:AAA family ATPase [Deltaproteobacteria bacterium]
MFPLEFDHRVLESLPLPDEESIKRVLQILKTVVMGRVLPYFRKKRGTDPTLIARVSERFTIQRLEDEPNRIRIASLVSRKDKGWIIHIHERIFDYFCFVMPSDPQSRLGGKTPEEGKILAFAEFLLRHEMEHMLYPQESEREVIRSDVAFAMDRRTNDPTFYRMLLNVLADEMTGLKGEPYLALFDSAEQERTYEYLITRILFSLVMILGDLPEELLQGIFVTLDTDLKTRVLGECYRRTRDTSYSLVQRTSCLQEVLQLFALIMEQDEKEAEKVFDAFKDRWGLIYLFHELDLPETSLEDKDPEEIFTFLKENLKRLSKEKGPPFLSIPAAPGVSAPKPEPSLSPVKTLKNRIEEARGDPLFPRQALEVIDKNKVSAVGHSGPKYTELIETLLAIPWGKMQKIKVSAEAFEEGLDRTHYGLKRPKEIICDFFANLIWRYQQFSEGDDTNEHQTGSAFLFVGPPGVGKTSLAISIADNLGISYHKISLGGMRDEADLRGHGFTYEGSKPGAIVQGLIKMGVMNGMIIMDEADKTEKFAISTLLEILDPEQNHLFHDKYIQTTVDIDLSNCHFILTANTLETVPSAVINRCEVVLLDRYSVDEKVAIARQHLIRRVRKRYRISEDAIFFDRDQESDLLRHLIKIYTYEPGVRELERIIRTLFLRVLRKEILAEQEHIVRITREKIKQYLETPGRPQQINDESRVGEVLALGVDVDRGVGSIIPIQATQVRIGSQSETRREGYLSMVHATGNIQKIMDESRKVATTGILHCADDLRIDLDQVEAPIHLHFMGASTSKDGPSAGGAIALALASALSGRRIRRDIAMTGEIDTQGRIKGVGGLDVKLETAYDAGCKTMMIPKENLRGDKGIERLPDALKQELQIFTYEKWKGDHEPFDYKRHVLQIVAVDHIVQAADVAFIDEEELAELGTRFINHARSVAKEIKKARKDSRPCFRLLYTKDPKELDLEGIEEAFWEGCKCVFLSRSKVKEAILANYPALEKHIRFRDFNPSREDLTTVIREIQKSLAGDSTVPLRVSLVAPFFFLKRDGISPENFPPDLSFEKLRLFANNYTLQGVKIKTCKSVLNRVYCDLAQLESPQADACFFLEKRDGIYTVDLSFIPEKYRLDVKHAEEILNACLKKWLVTVEGPTQGTESRE